VDKRFLTDENYRRDPKRDFFDPTEADMLITQDGDLSYRVLNLANPFNDASTSYHHKSIGGYHGAKMRRYQDLIDRHLNSDIAAMIQSLNQGKLNLNNFPVLNMLNMRYIKVGPSKDNVINNRFAMGNAWFVSNVIAIYSPEEEINALSNFNPKNEAIIDVSKFNLTGPQFDQNGTITLTEYKPNYLKYQSSNSNNGFAVFSEVYYPEGWRVSIDGQSAEHVSVNYILRGLEIPAGQHTVEFEFIPKDIYWSSTTNLICSLLVILLFLGAIFILIHRQW